MKKKTLNFKLLRPFTGFADALWGSRVWLACHAAMPLRDTYLSTLGLYSRCFSLSEYITLN